MSKAERISQRIEGLEAEYLIQLTAALSECAGGRWGLFGQNEHLGNWWHTEKLEELRDLADSINVLRDRIGEAPYELHAEFEAARGRGDSNQVGEPKLAQHWLSMLEAD